MTYRFQLAHLRVFQSYLERIYPSNDSGFDLIFFPIFFFNFRIPNHRSYVDCRKTKKRFAVHPSHYFPVKKLLKHVGTHLKSRLDAIQGSDYFRDGQTDRRRPHAPALYTDHSLSHPSQVPSLWAPTTKPSIWSLLPCCQLTKPILSSMRTG